MAQAVKRTKLEISRQHAAERMRGMFANVAAERRLVDELIAERHAEARLEDRVAEIRER